MKVMTVITGVVGFALLQSASKPPMKLGLWETSNSTTMSMEDSTPHQSPILKWRSCLTAESWRKAFGGGEKVGNASCTRSHETFERGHYSFDLTCPSISGTGHGEMTFSDISDTGHGTLHLDMVAQRHQIATDSVIDTRFIREDCGSLAPERWSQCTRSDAFRKKLLAPRWVTVILVSCRRTSLAGCLQGDAS